MTEQPLSNSEIIHYTNWWCCSLGFKSTDLENHPKIEDVLLLVKFRQRFWSDMLNKERSTWGAIWGWVYLNKYTITNKNLGKLEKIINNIQYRQELHNTQRNKIKALRQA
jgi:hypothetical protein